ncbi:hypothetical protein [Actinomadura sp. 9N215]|uniref:hypothetical protein n=1 Tax=Actinomadura sp. 9N215 TaxID=3375150 RepID=UPI00379C37D0
MSPRDRPTRGEGEGVGSTDDVEEVDAEVLYAEFLRWEAAGRPGAISHEEVTRFLLGQSASEDRNEDAEAAEAAAISAKMDEWEAAGRPGAKSHEEVMAEILGDAGEP